MALPFAWFALLLGAVFAGLGLVALLVARPRLELPAFLAATAALGGSGYGFVMLASAYGSAGSALLTALLGVGAFLGGYGFGSALLPLLARWRRPQPLPAPGTGRRHETAYILLSRAETETYRPSSAARNVMGLSEPGATFVPVALLPFMFAAQKARYRLVQGRSPARETVRAIAQRLAAELGVPEVAVAWCDPPGSLAERVREAAGRGHSKVVVGVLGVAQSRPEALAKNALEELLPAEAGIEVDYAEPLWASVPIAGLVAARASSFTDSRRDSGVVVVMQGQPPAWEEGHGDFDQQEAAFAGRVATLVAETGVPEGHVRTAWADWRTPDVTEAVRHLAALGCERVAVVPAAFPTETLDTMLDLPRQSDLARTEAAVQVLPPWGSEPVVAREIAARMREVSMPG